MKKVASCSFGKDSLAAIIVSEEHGVHIDEAIYCRIMFDDQISAELPEHEEFIHEVAIPTLEKRYGIKTTIVQAEETYCSRFFTRYQKGGKIGQIYGFPMRRGAWCNSHLKIRPIGKWKKTGRRIYDRCRDCRGRKEADRQENCSRKIFAACRIWSDRKAGI